MNKRDVSRRLMQSDAMDSCRFEHRSEENCSKVRNDDGFGRRKLFHLPQNVD